MSEFRAHEPDAAQWHAELVKLQSQVARERASEAASTSEPIARQRPRRASRLILALVALAVILAVLFGPGILGGILDRWDYARSVHHDRSSAAHGIRPQLERQALVVVRALREGGAPARMSAAAFAGEYPIASNESAERRARRSPPSHCAGLRRTRKGGDGLNPQWET